jgi:hypothetical protein
VPKIFNKFKNYEAKPVKNPPIGSCSREKNDYIGG